MQINREAVQRQVTLLRKGLNKQKANSHVKNNDTLLPDVAMTIDDLDSYHINSTHLFSGDKFRDFILTVITNIISSYRITHRDQDLDVIHDLIDKVQSMPLQTVYYVNNLKPNQLAHLKPMTYKQLSDLLKKEDK